MGLRWGILGAASIADSAIIPAIQANSGSTVVSIASRDPDRASALGKKHGVQRGETYSKMLASDDVDAVYIPLPVASHLEWIKHALAAGKHVLCEKPLAMNCDEIRELIVLRDESKLVCAEGMMIIHNPQWKAAMDLVSTGAIGELKRVDGCFSYYLDDPSSIRNQGKLGGGALRDIGVYPVAATRIVTGLEPTHLECIATVNDQFATDTYADCTVQFPGFELHFYCSTLMGRRQSMVFHGTKGWFEFSAPFTSARYRDAELILRRDIDGEFVVRHFGHTRVQYERMIANFEQAVLAGHALAYPLESSLLNQRVIDVALAGGGTLL